MMRCLSWPTLLAALMLSMQLRVEALASPVPDAQVARAQFSRSIENHEPVDQVVLLSPPENEVYFFSELRHLQGRTVTHQWEYRGQVVSRVPFQVRGPRWRVFSKKTIEPEQFGEWSVTVIDQSGWPLHTELFRYERADADVLPTPADVRLSE